MKYLYYLIIFLRIVFAPLILIWPIIAIIVSFSLDMIDAEFAHYIVTKKQYQLIDKSLDLWYLIFILIFVFLDLSHYQLLLIILFLYRLIGQGLYYFKKDRKYLFFFPNFFEGIFYLIFFGRNLSPIYFYLLLFLIITLKILQEWSIHIADLSFREDILKSKRKWKK